MSDKTTIKNFNIQTIKDLFDDISDSVTLVTLDKKIIYYNVAAKILFPVLEKDISCDVLDNDSHKEHNCELCPMRKSNSVQSSYIKNLGIATSFSSKLINVDGIDCFLVQVRVIKDIFPKESDNVKFRFSEASKHIIDNYLDINLSANTFNLIIFKEKGFYNMKENGIYTDALIETIDSSVDYDYRSIVRKKLSLENLKKNFDENNIIVFRYKMKNLNIFMECSVSFLTMHGDKFASAITYDVSSDVFKDLDVFTGLLNRSAGEREISKQISEHPNEKFTLVMFDIDNFKMVNDTYGHIKGDQCILDLSKHLLSQKKYISLATRLGGDEFAGICKNLTDINLEEFENKFKDFSNDENINDFSVSIGMANYPEDGNSFRKLYAIADRRMYQVKKIKHNEI